MCKTLGVIMRTSTLIILTLLILIPTIGKGQTDSIEVFKLNDNYIEMKSTRHVLKIDSFSMSPTMTFFTYSIIPKPTIIKNGVILIRDRQDKILKLYIYSDSTIIHEDHYLNGRLSRQVCNYTNDTLNIEKYYWDNGNLRSLIIYSDKKQIVYDYSENGQLDIRPKE
jgi:antitoxin component YwqK of YwqJK toxin-antitoxin module